MARRETSAETQATMTAPPAGMQRSGSAIATGWFDHKQIGNTLCGMLIGVYEAPSKLRAEGTAKFFQVQLEQPCQVREGRGEDAKVVEAKVGDIINVNYGPKTKTWEVLADNVQRGGEVRVWGQITGQKIKLSGGRTMHAFDTRHQVLKAPIADDDVGDFDGSADAEEAQLS